MSGLNLETKLVGNIAGRFIIQGYQRGYRWDKEVTTLLTDIDEIAEADYCLQPIVVKVIGDGVDELKEFPILQSGGLDLEDRIEKGRQITSELLPA